ncbi:hypothetical protein WR164_06840 [Philodulcilactobacillus myokoensis]|uniref:Uncharacterized protein n=1 Tax=Philodulcilactobacillus myokoensis TaxID=2929573 RepID=A0A9W6B0L3_9LACO|nr:hypothetical protein [Philodulcilactobacillus myokoensis]GLB46705.1 hypothetical protein WR164_06840 [Philodulcilactobacillus myokoensis]
MISNVKNGSATVIAIYFLLLLTIILEFQIIDYKNETWLNNQLIRTYQKRNVEISHSHIKHLKNH